MPFLEDDVIQIRDLFDLPRQELQPNSWLRTRMQLVQTEDATYNTDIVEEIQTYLAEISEIDNQLMGIDTQDPTVKAIGIIQTETISQEQSTSNQSSQVSDPTAFLSRRRNFLLGKIFRDLDLSRPTFNSRYVRS